MKSLAVAAIGVGMLGLADGIAVAEPDPKSAAANCLWAGAGYGQGTTVRAGGWNFRCGIDNGGPYWFQGERATGASTVPNPGARSNPAGVFSPGARQPGTAYTDYCVGGQLIAGTEDVYQAVAHGNSIYWKAAAPIGQWTFDSAAERPEPTWRTGSLCYEGNLT
ncbi:hypothetical protein [Nocardia arthritidis]|uniref:Uncharacterized protein n=1 Tax=Nocardia arthritidis TaxID=228602 RepID=A0A6G9Y8X3_9NOCA|nr:hypothetical protein [Nocardia arthritidis]QIS09570.1 hypothetical protein F5544_08340 [Nocardia arthritidis]